MISELRFLDDRFHWPGLQSIVWVRSDKKENRKDHAEDPLLCFLFAWRCRKVQYQDQATLGYRKQPALVIGRAFQRRYSAKEIRKLGYQFLN